MGLLDDMLSALVVLLKIERRSSRAS